MKNAISRFDCTSFFLDPCQHFKACNGKFEQLFEQRKSRSSVCLFLKLLERVRVLPYNSDKDFLCNHVATENLVENLTWNGAKGMEAVPQGNVNPLGTSLTSTSMSHHIRFSWIIRAMLAQLMGVDLASIEKAAPYIRVGELPLLVGIILVVIAKAVVIVLICPARRTGVAYSRLEEISLDDLEPPSRGSDR
ncbi:hypothetical protein K470DRAFT_279230 [Piedraia hortae CBS 480.64]|uniref:Uncharacterized protein n=1 Tax=Piedraia hortae CBS 480.64 TaxID=1314780 RepID=A0A6A7BQY8_9PEZI|nr:hypothetical protein K470DRAFT_279230 [Piedraia hortae CBS 480.64]